MDHELGSLEDRIKKMESMMSKLKQMGIVAGGDAGTLGIGVITDARAKATFDFGVAAKLVDPTKVKLADTYTTDFVRDLRVLP